MTKGNFDKYGLPLTNNGDGGDSAATAGNLLATGYPVPIQYYLMNGEPVRHPDKSKWYGRPGRFSRDQLVALLCGLALSPGSTSVSRKVLFKMHLKRGLILAWNRIRNFQYETIEEHLAKSTPDVKWNMEHKMPDICGPEVLALWIRVWRVWILWPLLLILDLENLFGSIHWHFRKDRVARNHMLATQVAWQIMPTPWSLISYEITPWAELKRRWKGHCETMGEIYAMEQIGR